MIPVFTPIRIYPDDLPRYKMTVFGAVVGIIYITDLSRTWTMSYELAAQPGWVVALAAAEIKRLTEIQNERLTSF